MTGATAIRWTYRPDCPKEQDHLRQGAGLPLLAAKVLANRGFHDVGDVRTFMDAPLNLVRDPFELADVQPASERVAQAIRSRESVAIFGDYDADGVCATTILLELFQHFHTPATFHIPHRVAEGYGLSIPAIERLAAQGVRLIITVDNGISSIHEVERARALGVEVIVTDHHEQGETLPAALAVINPKRLDAPYAPAELCGAGVAWKLAHGVLRAMDVDPAEGREFLTSQLDLVALATVADMAPLTGENRILVRAGLRVINENPRVALRALIRVAGLSGRISSKELGYFLAPRLNAVGRTQSADMAVALLLEQHPDRAYEMAQEMNTLNTQRRTLEKQMLDEAMEEYERLDEDEKQRVIIVAREGWHVGLVGLIASRLAEMHYRPSFVVSLDRERNRAKGSARSIAGFNLHEALGTYFDNSDDYGGHAMAAGFNLPLQDLDAFRAAMVAFAEKRLLAEMLRPEILIDADIPLPDLTLDAVEALESLEPFGEGNPRPLISFSDVSLADTPRVVGANHLKLRLCQSGTYISAIGWRMGGLDSHFLRHQGAAFSVVGSPLVNEFRGRRYPEIELCDIRFD